MKNGFNAASAARHSGFVSHTNTFTGQVNEAIESLQANGLANANNNVGAVLKMESRSSDQEAVLSAAKDSAASIVNHIVGALGLERNPTDNPTGGSAKLYENIESMKWRAENAAKFGYALAIGHNEFQGRELAPVARGNGDVVVNASAADQGRRMTLRSEAFNNINLRSSVAFSMGFNAAVTRQTDVVMTWFPPIFISPDQTSIEIQVCPLQVFNGAHHALSADKTNFARRDVARAFADGSILGRSETALIPVARSQNADKLVDVGDIANFDLTMGRRTVTTNFILFNTDVNLLSLGATDAILATGQQSHRDTIEPGAKLWKIAVKSGDDIIELNMRDLKTTNFIGSQQGDQMESALSMRLAIGLGKNLTRRSGAALTGPLASLVTNDYRVLLRVNGSGTINVETGNAKVQAPTITVEKLIDGVTGDEITGAALTAIRDAVAAFEYLGWLPLAYRTNANRRQQGDIINARRFNFHYVVPYRDPITAERPAHKQNEHDAQDLTNLLSLTRIRLENEAIDAIIQADEQLASYVDVRTNDLVTSDIVGLAQFYLLATYHRKTLNMVTAIDSLSSGDRAKDIQSVLIMTIRDTSSRLYTESQWKAGADVQSGGTLPAPQLLILTDPIIARYMLEPGDLRTAGDFEFVVTTTLNYQVRGKIFMAFRTPGSESSNEPNIFNFGHLFMSPELVLAANMTREGSYFAETQVQPRYEFAVMAPVMARIDVTGIPEVLSKVPHLVQLSGTGTEIDNPVFMQTVTP